MPRGKKANTPTVDPVKPEPNDKVIKPKANTPAVDPAMLAELEALRDYKAKTEKARNEDVGLTDKYLDYEVKEGEEGHVHLLVGRIVSPDYNDRSKDKLDHFYPHIVSEPAYRNFLDNQHILNVKVIRVLHLPEGIPTPEEYRKQQAEKKAKARATKVTANPEAALTLNA